MIKKYKQFNEGLLDKLKGPSMEELLKNSSPERILKTGVELNDLDMVKFAVEHGANVYGESQMVLFFSIHHKNNDMILYLLEHGANLKDENIIGILKLNDIELFKEVLEKYKPSYQLDDSILFYAVSVDNIDAAKFLIENGLNVDFENGTPLRCAIVKNNLELVELLVDNGATITQGIIDLSKKSVFIESYLKRNFKKTNEGVLDRMKGPTEEEVGTELKYKLENKEISRYIFIKSCVENSLYKTLGEYFESFYGKAKEKPMGLALLLSVECNNLEILEFLLNNFSYDIVMLQRAFKQINSNTDKKIGSCISNFINNFNKK